MQKQDGGSGFGTGFAIDDIQFFNTNSSVADWILFGDEYAFGCHFVSWW